jgi:hypothetical protein
MSGLHVRGDAIVELSEILAGKWHLGSGCARNAQTDEGHQPAARGRDGITARWRL